MMGSPSPSALCPLLGSGAVFVWAPEASEKEAGFAVPSALSEEAKEDAHSTAGKGGWWE